MFRREERIIEYIKEENVKNFANILANLFNKLAENGQVKVSGKLISPPEKCRVMLRYEIMPGGEYSLKVELLWEPESRNSKGGDEIIKIE